MIDLQEHGIGGSKENYLPELITSNKTVEMGFAVSIGDVVEILDNGKVRKLTEYNQCVKTNVTVDTENDVYAAAVVSLDALRWFVFTIGYENPGIPSYYATGRVADYDPVGNTLTFASRAVFDASSGACILGAFKITDTKIACFYTYGGVIKHRIATLTGNIVAFGAEKVSNIVASSSRLVTINQANKTFIIVGAGIFRLDVNDNIEMVHPMNSYNNPRIGGAYEIKNRSIYVCKDGRIFDFGVYSSYVNCAIWQYDEVRNELWLRNILHDWGCSASRMEGYHGLGATVLLDKFIVGVTMTHSKNFQCGGNKIDNKDQAGKVLSQPYLSDQRTYPFALNCGEDGFVHTEFGSSGMYAGIIRLDSHNFALTSLSDWKIESTIISRSYIDGAVNGDYCLMVFSRNGSSCDLGAALVKAHVPYPYGIAISAGVGGQTIEVARAGLLKTLSDLKAGKLYVDRNGKVRQQANSETVYIGFALSPRELLIDIGGDV